MTTMMDTVKYKHRSRAALTLALFMGLSSCSLIYDDIDPEQAKGDVMLKVDARGIVVDPSDANYDVEEYVKTLRLIGVADGVQAFNVELNDLSGYEVQGTEPNTYIEIPLEGEDALPAGAYTIYAVANEEAVTGLSLDALPSVTVPAYTTGTAPSLFLMSDVTPAVIDPRNTDTEISIELVRTLAKIRCGGIYQKTEDGGKGDPLEATYTMTVSGSLYDNYPLFKGGTASSSTSSFTDITRTDATPVYLSESGDNAVTISISATIDGKTYTSQDNSWTLKLERNHDYEVCGLIEKTEEATCLQLNIDIKDWEVNEELKPSYE